MGKGEMWQRTHAQRDRFLFLTFLKRLPPRHFRQAFSWYEGGVRIRKELAEAQAMNAWLKCETGTMSDKSRKLDEEPAELDKMRQAQEEKVCCLGAKLVIVRRVIIKRKGVIGNLVPEFLQLIEKRSSIYCSEFISDYKSVSCKDEE